MKLPGLKLNKFLELAEGFSVLFDLLQQPNVSHSSSS